MSSNSQKVTPIFLLSLPRSGSTLVQRILAMQPEVATTSEPWILLPFLYTLRDRGAYANYSHVNAVTAIEDLYGEFPNGQEDYLQDMRNFVLNLYMKTSSYNDQKYFLDKTPRYHLIVEEIMRMFPDGKFIFLWRNPLAVVASIMHSLAEGKWILYSFNIDLFTGIENLINAYEKHSSRVCSIRYENVLTRPVVEFERVCSYLDLSFDPVSLSDFSTVKLRGRYGDPTGVKYYQSLSKAPLNKWKDIINNPIRRLWCQRYLCWIGQERLAVMGYDLNELLAELKNVPQSLHFIGSDIVNIIYGSLYRTFEPRIIKHKFQDAKSWHRINAHT